MREPYICPHCNHRSTRRWNLDVHIKRKHGEYLVDRSLDVMANNPPLYNHSIHLRNARVADDIDKTFHPAFLPQQAVLGTSQYFPSPTYPPVDVSRTFANPMYRPMQIVDNPSYRTSLFQDNRVKIQELK